MYEIDVNFGFSDGSMEYKNVCFSFQNGDIINIIGENGCGKSTFYKMLMGKVKPLRGKICDNIKDNIVVISDYINIPKEVLVADILNFIDEEKIIYVHNFFPEIYNYIFNLKDSKILLLSTGERRLLEILCALSTQKSILVLDEANNGLDIKNRLLLIDNLKKISQSEKVTVFNTSHYFEDLKTLGGRVFIMNKKKSAFEEYKQEFTVDKIMKYLGSGV